MAPAILASARAWAQPLALARRVSPDAPRAAPRRPARLPARRPVEPIIAVRGAPSVRVDGVRGVRRRGSRVVSRAASAGGVWRLWPFAHAWAVDDPTIEADAAGDSPGADQHQQHQQQQQQQQRGDETNPWRTVALVLGAMLVAALVHPPLASASSTLIAAVAANVVAPVGVLYPVATYVAAGAQAWANNAVGVVGTLVSSAASAGAGYAAASARARAEMEELRAEIAVIREAAAAVGISATSAVGNPAVVISASEPRPAIAEETRGAVVPTEDPVVTAERASAEAELADLRRQLARLRAVWTPNDDDDDEGDDAGERGVGGGAASAGDAEGVSKRDGGDGVTRASSAAAAAGSVDARAAGGDVDWRAAAKSRAVWSPSVDDDDDDDAEVASSPASVASSSSSFYSSTAIDEEEAARISAEIVALRAELAGVRGVGEINSRMTVPVPGAPGSPGDLGGVGSGAREASGPVDWAALAKSRALWSPSDDDDGDGDDDVDAEAARGESRASAVDGFGETGERARLLEEDAAWRRRLGMTENAQDDQPLGH